MFFSVIVPVYNVEKYLRECIDSVLAQTFEDFELILVDDGSTDSSGCICDEYAEKDSRIKVIHKENEGQSTARNKGIENASGFFAVFLDSDDFFCDSRFLQDVRNCIEKETEVIIYRYCKYYDDGRIDPCGIHLANIDCREKTSFLKELICRDAFFCSCWSKCVRLSLLKQNQIQFDSTLSCEDMDWYYHVVSKAQHYKVIDKPYIYYRQHANSVTSTFSQKSIVDYIATVSKWSDCFEKIKNAEERFVMLSSLAKLYCNLLISYSRHRNELKVYQKDIFSYRYLLNYDLNPRTTIIHRFSCLFGLRMTCFLMRVFEKVR